MTLKSDIDQLAADAVLMHQVIHGDASTTVTTANGPVRSVAKLIADKDAEINVSASGILAQSVAQVGFATTQAVAAGNALSQVNVAVAQALSAAGTAGQYSTALAAIASQTAIVPAATVPGFNGVVVASCIDDTRKWSDSGAARKRTQNTSWYNEATTATGKNLGKLASLAAAWAVTGAAVGDHYYDTTTKLFYSIGGTSAAPTRAEIFRGPRKNYPETVFWTVEAGRVIGWDATDASFPMWIVFIGSSGQMARSNALTSIFCINGVLLLGGILGVSAINFVADSGRLYYGGQYAWSAVISARNTSPSSGWLTMSGVGIVNYTVNSVAATVLPTSPIDPATGLPTPTIYAFTAGGVSRIADDGTVSSTTSQAVNSGWIDGNFVRGICVSAGTCGSWPITSTLPAGTAGVALNNAGWTAATYYATSIPAVLSQMTGGEKGVIRSTLGVSFLKENPSSPTLGMVANISNAYTSGWQIGDSRGAWLADTTVETVSGAELVTNGAFNTDLAGWTSTGVTWVAGAAKFDGATAAPGLSSSAGLATRIGGTYRIAVTISGRTSGSCYLIFGGVQPVGNNLILNKTYVFTMVATSTYSVISCVTPTGIYDGTIDNVSVIEYAADRSAKNNHLVIYGSLNKSPVAVGSQLVGWSGFAAATNYLEQAYSASLDFDTGDFCFPIWINPSTAAQNSTLFTRSAAALSGNGFALNLVAGVLQLGRSIAGAAFTNTTFSYTPPVGIWTLVNLVRVAGVIALRVNGIQQATTIADTNNYTNTTAVFTVGVDYTHANPFVGSLALLRASATPASADQGVYRYETERKLFEPGVQCCIAGTSTAVTAMDYDDSTNLLSAATSWGVTEFQGLKAINSYATTVGAPSAIATRGGYKLLSGATGSSFYKPSLLLAEELTRTWEQRKAFGSTLKKRTDFELGIGEEPVSVYQMGTLKDEGAGAGLHTVSNSGFRKTIKLGTAATLGDRVTIFYTLNL